MPRKHIASVKAVERCGKNEAKQNKEVDCQIFFCACHIGVSAVAYSCLAYLMYFAGTCALLGPTALYQHTPPTQVPRVQSTPRLQAESFFSFLLW
jgi:hypothetical protein